MLRGGDRALFEAYFRYGMSTVAIARLSGMRESAVRRRLLTLLQRVASNQYLRCRAAQAELSAFELRVAGLYYRDGKSQAEIATTTGRSLYQVGKAVRRLWGVAGKRPSKRERTGCLKNWRLR